MKLFGLEIRLSKKGVVSPWNASEWSRIFETSTGGWQRGEQVSREDALSFATLFACVSLIASDFAKLGVKLVQKMPDGIWKEVDSRAFSPVLRKPNRYQTTKQFFESWMLSKLLHGNTYVLKVRDNRNVVVALYVLDPQRVKVLVAPGAAVFYEIQDDNLSTIGSAVRVPASEIIHDRFNTLYHPLIGIPPVAACALAAGQGVNIQRQAKVFFENLAQPGGSVSAPGTIPADTVARLKEEFKNNFGGNKRGNVAILGDGLEFKPWAMTARDSQLSEQLKLSSEQICTAFRVQPYMVGVGPAPTYQNAAVLTQIYYSQCLQVLIEQAEAVLDEGLSLPINYGVEFVLDDLLRMDALTQMQVVKEGVSAGVFSPNEGRQRFNLPPVDGGETPYLQQQNFSLAALSRRDEAFAQPGAVEPPPVDPAKAIETFERALGVSYGLPQ